MRESLLERLPLEKIRADVIEVLSGAPSPDGQRAARIELDAEWVTVSLDEPIEVVSRCFHTHEFQMGWGDCYRALAAIGGVTKVAHGIPEAGKCFVTLWYTPTLQLITADFSTEMP